jgi:hypothetical protein
VDKAVAAASTARTRGADIDDENTSSLM